MQANLQHGPNVDHQNSKNDSGTQAEQAEASVAELAHVELAGRSAARAVATQGVSFKAEAARESWDLLARLLQAVHLPKSEKIQQKESGEIEAVPFPMQCTCDHLVGSDEVE